MNRLLRHVALAVACSLSMAAHAQEFTIASWGGVFQDNQRLAYFAPFTKATGIRVNEDTYIGGWAPLQAIHSTKNFKWDVVQVEGPELLRGCEEGVFLPIDWKRIRNADQLRPEAKTECGLGVTVTGTLAVYNTASGAKAPAKLADFFDTKAYPGKRAIRKGPKINLEFALLADGVPPADIYKVLRAEGGVERAFRVLDRIKSDLVFWEAGAQPVEMLGSGNVAMALMYNGRYAVARKEGKPFEALWDRGTYSMDYWVVFSGSKKREEAYRFLDHFVKPQAQANFIDAMYYGPTMVGVEALVAPQTRELMPTGERTTGHLFSSSTEALTFWLDNYPRLLERWSAWVASR